MNKYIEFEHTTDFDCSCAFCMKKIPFEFPKDLFQAFMSGKAALFAGAGISTENRLVLPNSFYECIALELRYRECTLPFPELMEEFCQQIDGRLKLLGQIKSRFQYVESFPEIYRNATRFHKELSTFYPLNNIITTNWDNYFERECAATPFITEQDLAFWDTPGRKVIKIHGSIENYGSIVASTADYQNCEANLSTGIIGGILKQILATQTIVFMGYSYRDQDFINIYNFVKDQMQSLNKQAYIVTTDKENDDYYREQNLIPIYTDGTYFIEQLKKIAENKDLFIPDSIYETAQTMLDVILFAHRKLYDAYDCVDNPETVMCGAYQDGLMHGFERMIALKNTGIYSNMHQTFMSIDSYYERRREELRARRYENVAYIDGYVNALQFITMTDEEQVENPLPLYYAFGKYTFFSTFEEYKEVVPEIPKLHKAAYQRAKKMVDTKFGHGKGAAIHHPAWL